MKTAVFDRSRSKFSDFFRNPVLFTDMDSFMGADFTEFATIAINGLAGRELVELPYGLIEKLWDFALAGGKIYGELIACHDFPASRLFGFRQDFPVTFRRLEKLKWNTDFLCMESKSNLLEWNGPFQTGFPIADTVILEIDIFQETHFTEKSGRYPGLVVKKHGKGTVVYSAFSLFSNSEFWSLRPTWLWNKVIHALQEDSLLPVLPMSNPIHFRNQRIEESVANSIGWFQSSGIMADPAGKKGVYENIHSFRREVSKDIRPDCSVQTALMFHLYGRYTGERKWGEICENILTFLFHSGFQDLEKDSQTFGLWKWFQFPGKKPDQMFSDDNAWVALVLLYLYRQTGNEEYKKRGLATVDALLDTQNRNGLRVEVLLEKEVLEKGASYYARSEEGNMNPHFQSIVHAAFLQAYLVTEEGKYLDTALKGTRYLLDHPGKMEFMYSKTAGYSRFLLGLSQVYALSGDKRIKKGLFEVLNYLEECMHGSGGVEEADNPSPARYGTEDTGVFIDNGEGIADQLYTNNFLAMNAWEAWQATGDKKVFDFHTKITEFLNKIQIHSSEKLVDGGWMRSFHLDSNEYFGNNGDTGWGPYCMESGWTNAVTTAGLLLRLTDSSLLE
ncbi:hypothetical protein [Bacillus sp. REN3]|uniref:hypothetical protein n=1 Tax=Bacillus sp. REN3 TaxID=2802440 RepID=UPI001AED712A|nr:hypothetical protein [Bacillus sp. REN3]